MSMRKDSSIVTTDIIHGIAVADPYRWLEDSDSTKTRLWIKDQQVRYEAYFANIPWLDILTKRVNDFLGVAHLDQPSRIANKHFYRFRDSVQEQGDIFVRDTTGGFQHSLVGATRYGRWRSIGIHRVSNDGSRMAFEVRSGGSDTKEIHILDIAEKRVLPESLEDGYARGFSFESNGDGFFYSHEIVQRQQPHSIFYHRFGTAVRDDVQVFEIGKATGSRFAFIADRMSLGAILLREQDGILVSSFYLKTRNKTENWNCIFADKPLRHSPFLHNGRIFILTNNGAPNGRIVELNVTGEIVHETIPENDGQLRSVQFVEDTIYTLHFEQQHFVLRVWSLSGALISAIQYPSSVSIELIPGCSEAQESLFYRQQSFSRPPEIFEYVRSDSEPRLWWAPDLASPITKVRTREISYPSKDGCSIPMTLVMRDDIEPFDIRPTIMTSYGGFGVAMTPQFSVLVTIMIELGAIFAMPRIRGGSDLGVGWHEAARGRNRQVAFDDFIAAAEWLCQNNISNRQTLAVFGGSNSGLLVGAAMTQRPELFRAVVCIAPLLDMLRYEGFDQARKWISEYGSVSNKEDFIALCQYSPYHQIDRETNYPATLFVTGDNDNRSNPAHVRKMAARLQDRPNQLKEIIVDYNEHRGHSPAMPLSTRIQSLARRLSFLCNELGIAVSLGDVL